MRVARLAVVVVAGLCLPFLGKAFHIDDPGFLAYGARIGWDPLALAAPAERPIEGDGYMGQAVGGLPWEATHPFLWPYVLKILTFFAGESERAAHLLTLAFAILAVVATARLAEGLAGRPAAIASLFLAACPAFVVSAQSAMTDVPTLALVLAGLSLLLRPASERTRPALLGGALLAAATLVSYTAAFYLPIPFVAAGERRRQPAFLVALALPLAACAVMLGILWGRYRFVPFLTGPAASSNLSFAAEVARSLQPSSAAKKGLSLLANLGAWLLPALVVALGAGRRERRFALRWVLPAAGFGVAAFALAEGALLQRSLAGVLAASGVLVLCLAAAIGLRARRTALLLWAAIAIAVNLFLLPYGNARYLLPAMPPLLMLLLSTGAPSPADEPPRRPRLLVPVALVLSIALSLAAAWVDAAHADAYREFAGEVRTFASSVAPARVFFIGEWGMRFYFSRAGARYLTLASLEPRDGDYLILAETVPKWAPSPLYRSRLHSFATREFPFGLPLRIFNFPARAGFYSHLWGLAPLAFSSEPVERFHVFQFVPFSTERH